MKNLCGLGALAEQAIKNGYKNPNGSVNLFMAGEVMKKYGRLLPKEKLSAAELKEFEEAGKKLLEKLTKPDSFVKTVN